MLEAKAIIAIVIVFAIAGMVSGYTLYERHQAVAAYEQKVNEQEAKLKEKDDKLIAVANDEIVHTTAAYEAGQAKAKVVVQTRIVKGQSYVANTPAFSNPQCVIPADGLLVLNSARAALRTATDTADFAPAVPGTGAVTGRQDGNAVPSGAQGPGAVGRVPAPPRQVDRNNQVPGSGVPAHPKPKPVT